MSEEDNTLEKIYIGVSSYLEFIKDFKHVKNDDVITGEKNNNKNVNFSYTIRPYNLECYIIDKKYFDEFRKSINFNELIKILNDINEETKKKFKEELKKHLIKYPYKSNSESIKFYSKEEEIKEIVKNFNNYSFVNRGILCDAMNVPISKLEGKMFKASKNGNNTSLLSASNFFTLTINIEKINQENIIINNSKESAKNTIKEYKNLYYVEEVTKKVFVLLYFFERNIQKKIKREIKDIYNFKKYYLINNEWLNEYKEFFMYDFIKKKLDNEYKDSDYSYKKIKNSLDKVVKDKIGQIGLYNETKLPHSIRNANNLECKNEKYSIDILKDVLGQETLEREQKENIYTPNDFYIIDEYTYNLLIQEEFFYNLDNKISNKTSFDVLLGNNQIIIINKIDKENNEKYKYSNDCLVFANNFLKENENEGKNINGKFILEYILNFGKDDSFYNNLENIIKGGLKHFITNKILDLDNVNLEQNIKDKKQNIIGKFINIRLDEEVIKKLSFKNNQIEEKKIENKDNKNSIIIEKNEEINNKENYNNINSNNNNNIIIINNKDDNNNKEIDNKNENEKPNNFIQMNENKKRNKSEVVINNNIILNQTEKNNFNINNKSGNEADSLVKNCLNLIVEQIVDDKNIENLEIENLTPDEINKQLKNNNKFLTEIIIMNEESNRNFTDLIALIKDKDNNILQIDSESIKKRIDNNFKLIENYKDYKKKKNKKFYVLSKAKFFEIYKNNIQKIEKFYHFKYRNNSYIFVENDIKIIKIEKDENFEKNNLLILKDIDKKVKEFLKNINEQIKKNRNITEFNKNINECYLINKNWLKQKLEFEENQGKENTLNKITEPIQPEMKDIGYYGLKYPINFGIIFKNTPDISENELFISLEDFYASKIIFVNWQNNIPKNISKGKLNKSFIGIIDKSNIYFYSIIDKEYCIEFVIKLESNSENIANVEIEKIFKKGIGLYLDEMGINKNKSLTKFLNDSNLNKVGLYINCKEEEKTYDIWKPNYTKSFKENKASYLNGILLCLANIELLNNFFMDREILKGQFDNDSIISKNFYKIIQDMWSVGFEEENKEENNNIYKEFKLKITEFTKNEKIFEDPKLLIEFLLLKIHNEIKRDINNIKNENENEILKLDVIYSGKENLQEEFYKSNNSIIQKLFFFEMEENDFDDNNKKYIINCTLDFKIENINMKKKEKINISKFLDDLNNNEKRKMITFPKILIIIINHNEEKNIQFEIEEEIDFKKYVPEDIKNNTIYQLISFVVKEKTFCKSPVNNKWYKYKRDKNTKLEDKVKLKKAQIPHILFYLKNS